MKSWQAALGAIALMVGAANGAPTTVSQHFDFASQPVTLVGGGAPVIVNVDFQAEFSAFDNLLICAYYSQLSGSLSYRWGVLYPDGATLDPCCTAPFPFGASSYSPSVNGGGNGQFVVAGAESSADMIQRAFTAAANDILDGQFRAFLWFPPECTGTGSFPYGCGGTGQSLTVTGIDIVLVNAEAKLVSEPAGLALAAVALLGLLSVSRHQGALRSRAAETV